MELTHKQIKAMGEAKSYYRYGRNYLMKRTLIFFIGIWPFIVTLYIVDSNLIALPIAIFIIVATVTFGAWTMKWLKRLDKEGETFLDTWIKEGYCVTKGIKQ